MHFAASCILPVAVLGAICGSFLNVVIFRLPRDQSIMRPRWSVCPHCRHRIRALDNVPILSWFLLRGRCHACHAPIAGIYPLIECTTALVFVTVWDALFLTGTQSGIVSPAGDWPMAVAYMVLFAGLLAMSAMDIEFYIIDIRVAVTLVLVGIASHGVWGVPGRGPDAPTGMLPPAACLIGAAMGVTWLLTWLVQTRFARRAALSGAVPDSPGTENANGAALETGDDVPSAYTQTAGQKFRPGPIAALCGVLLIFTLWQTFAADHVLDPRIPAGGIRGLLACALFMLILILASMVTRESDEQVIQEIEADRAKARPMVLREFAAFLPALAVGGILLIVLRSSGRIAADWQEATQAIAPLGTLAPHVAGIAQAFAAMVFAAALGWAVRILGTLAFGKEAFGSGDIYIMAAIGAVAGFWAVVFGFFLAALLALVGVLATLFRKTSRAIPFGPWLALGAFVTLWLQGRFLDMFGPAGALLWSIVSGQPFQFSQG